MRDMSRIFPLPISFGSVGDARWTLAVVCFFSTLLCWTRMGSLPLSPPSLTATALVSSASVLPQMFPPLPPPSPFCCALDRRWCWAGGPQPALAEPLSWDTTWTKEKRGRTFGERSTWWLPERNASRLALLAHFSYTSFISWQRNNSSVALDLSRPSDR